MSQKIIAQHYILNRELGAGGMGTVYIGQDTRNQSTVAIKKLHSNLADGQLIERFKREGEALRELNHPNIVKMLDAVEEDGQHYLIMEYVAGGDLSNLLKSGQVSIEKALNITIDLADALTRAHRLNIIHRDLKPANILIGDDGTIRLTDFGVAHVGSKARVTDTDVIVGTIDYLPPEVFDGGGYDERGDIWAFGVILFEMLTGELPFAGETMLQVLQAITSQPIPDLQKLRSDTPTGLIDLVYRMLERDPFTRLSSVRHVGALLEDILKGRDTSAKHEIGRFDTPVMVSFAKRDNLPPQNSAFVGREAELAELSRILGGKEIRLITIIAPGGMGKTSLSIEVGRGELGNFEDGVFFVELAPLTSPDSIVSAIADVTGYQFIEDGRPHRQQILDYLASRNILLILDNFEHILDGAGIVGDILKIAPKVKILATSRQPLKQTGESLFHLSGMDFPDWETPEDAIQYAAVKLFMNSAIRALPSFELTQANLDYVARICRLVQGMPLGIVLAASWLAMLSPQEIASEMEKNSDILEDETGQLPERQRSIRAVMDYSWALMNEAEQESFMKLAVFRGGFTREAAEAIAKANLRLLMSLTNKSLIHRDAISGRYKIHELLRQYALEKLNKSALTAIVYAEHSAFYLDFLAKNTEGLKGGSNQFKILDELDDDFDNVQAAWRQALANQNTSRIGKSIEGLELLCNLRSHDDDAKRLFDDARQATLPEALREAIKIRFNGLNTTASVLEAALEAARARNDEKEAAYCLIKLGDLAHNIHQDNQKAIVYFEEASDIYRKLGEMHYLAETMMKLSEAHQQLGNFQKSGSLVHESHAIHEANRDKLGSAKTLRALGMDAYMRGDYATEMWKYVEGAYEIYFHSKNLAGQAEQLLFFGWGGLFMGEPHKYGVSQLEQARQLSKDIGMNTTQAWSTVMLSVYHSIFGANANGERWLKEAEAIEINPFQQTGAGGPMLQLITAWAKSLIALEHGKNDEARKQLLFVGQLAYQMHGIGILAHWFPIITILYNREKKYERAVEILGFCNVLMPGLFGWFNNWPKHQQAEINLRACLDENTFQAALERGKAMEVMTIAKQINDELSQE